MALRIPHSAFRILVPLTLFVGTFVLAALFAWRTPPWLAPDEPAHYAYVQHVATTGQPPILEARCYDETYKSRLTGADFREGVDLTRFCYEGHQPPLFYYLATPIYLLSDGSLLALRLFCALLGAGVPVAAWGIARAAGADEGLALATAGLVALVPQHLAMLGSLNNDALTFLVVALTVWQAVRLLNAREAAQNHEWVRLGVLVGLALITKTLAWVVLLPVGLLLLLRYPLSQAGANMLLRRALIVAALAALFILPWFARNALAYAPSDIMALQRHDEIAVGQPRTAEMIARRGLSGTISNGLRTTFNSFWGQFGWMEAPLKEPEYRVLGLFCLVALAGLLLWLARRGWREWGIDGRALLLFAVWVLGSAGLVLYYNLEFVQYQGRYLFPALAPLAFFTMVGLGAWLPARYRPLPRGALLLFLLYLNLLAVYQRLPGLLNS